MKANSKDFRIGNLVNLVNFRSKIYIVDKIEKEFVTIVNPNRENNYAILDYDSISGIELTEEWLLKFGFDKKSWKSQGIVIECFYYEKNGIIIYIIAKGFEIEVKHGDDQFNLFRVWNYVHQLQNLYFALTGEELTIK